MFTNYLKINSIFETHPTDLKNRPYGFFEVEVETPDAEDLKYPMLQTRIKTSDGMRTVAACGKWTGVYSTTELYFAMEFYNYKFKVLRGVLFPQTVLFEDFINHFYDIKSKTPKDNPRYFIAKIILNSLYGKMGQSYKFETHAIVNEDELLNLIQNKNIEVSSIVDLDEVKEAGDLSFISYLDNLKYRANNLDLLTSYKGSNPVASETAAKARVKMAWLIRHLVTNGYTIYYMDTDCLVVDKPLPDWLVSPTELGKLKLEYIIKEGVFLAPKVYAIKTNDGKVIIKVKGLSRETIEGYLTFDILKSLLIKDKTVILNQIKSNINISDSTIKLIDQTYYLIPSKNKRELTYKNK